MDIMHIIEIRYRQLCILFFEIFFINNKKLLDLVSITKKSMEQNHLTYVMFVNVYSRDTIPKDSILAHL